jgi:uncharacterized protein (TIGR02246 family)
MVTALTAEDRLDIIDLLARYAWAIDTGDVEGYVACFTSDAVVSMRGAINTGHEAIRAYVTSVVTRPEFPGRQHHHGEVRIEGDGERCRVKSYSTISQRFEGGETKVMFAGQYRDVVVKQGGRWLFAERAWDEWDPSRTASYRD